MSNTLSSKEDIEEEVGTSIDIIRQIISYEKRYIVRSASERDTDPEPYAGAYDVLDKETRGHYDW